jgi:hypothetical protein
VKYRWRYYITPVTGLLFAGITQEADEEVKVTKREKERK